MPPKTRARVKIAVMIAVIGAVCWVAWRAKKSGQDSVSETYNTFTDVRDGKKYKTAIIDGERWMVENLNYEIPGYSWCYDNNDSNCVKYGRLYHSSAAGKACPPGWYLPSREDWEDLDMAANGSEVTVKMLKAKNGWNRDTVNNESNNGTDDCWNRDTVNNVSNNESNNGTDDYGFAALPGGFRSDGSGHFKHVGICGNWWTVKPWMDENSDYRLSTHYICNPKFYYIENGYSESRDYSVSARCLQDSSGNLSDSAWLIKKEEKRKKKEERRLENLSVYFTDERDGRKYRSIVIGGKTWMAQNLDYETPDSSWCYENSVDSCAKYGRLYAWNAAMAACPAGWRLPSRQEWIDMNDSVGGGLESKSGWKQPLWKGKHSDLHGFSALPGGARRSASFDNSFDSSFYGAGAGEYRAGYWWSATKRGNGRTVYNMRITDISTDMDDYSDKSAGYSVRCIRRESGDVEEASDAEKEEAARRFIKENGSHFTDPRDGRKYRTIKIGDYTWMAENLNYHPPTGKSWCYKNNDSYCGKYGRLYDLPTAIRACPTGWHLSTGNEWGDLAVSAGGKWGRYSDGRHGATDWYEAGLYLKSKTGWKDDGDNGATDAYGFSALPGGTRAPNGKFANAGDDGYWWEDGTDDGCYGGCHRNMSYGSDMVHEWPNETDYDSSARYGHSVRCVADKRDTLSNGDRAPTPTPQANQPVADAPSPVLYDTLIDERDGKTYRTVKMPDGKVWMAENLNYRTDNSWCNDNKNTNCDKYGRLYNWNAAMRACPAGYSLPTRSDWNALGQAVGGERTPDERGNIIWDGAGKKLKAKKGWNKAKNKKTGSGTDDYGFSALPGGSRHYDGSFYNAGDYGDWWTATTNRWEYHDHGAYYRGMSHAQVDKSSADYLMESWSDKNRGYSVRCIKNADRPQSPSLQENVGMDKSKNNVFRTLALLTTVLTGGAVCWVAECGKPGHEIPNTFTDKRDGKTYKTATIGKRTWMAENLNYATSSGSWCYGDDSSNCDTYGRLYDWKTAMSACPSWWHLSTREDWDQLAESVGGRKAKDYIWDGWLYAGTKLKSSTGWSTYSGAPTGTNDFGFSALPGGGRSSGGNYYDVGDYGVWWTATKGYYGSDAYHLAMNYDDDNVYESDYGKSLGFSVRCVLDNYPRALRQYQIKERYRKHGN